ncbi:hypothetical protein N7E81_11220 [Reichenbachiella carrageenanivorans]|uniref:Cadherin domain-containing protein n=1 Tax=Reichenbachiella carrageenanivorans TaxID=2979869 RepID=A0ABY6CVJ9_9BACT|nr:hypothetical protein [Reichenbachiella carrageenanivorans]UXX77936.1 hypothetical protein N7E81_11220 [Reichenbachiella carrageenanivorans]
MTKKLALLNLLLFLFQTLSAQDSPSLRISQKFIEAKVGEQVEIKIEQTGQGSIVMKNAPKNAELSDEGIFKWLIPATSEDSKITVEFFLIDSTKLIDIESVFIKIIPDYDPPKFFIHSNQELKNGFYELHPGQTIELSVLGYASQDSSKVILDHFFNDNEGEYHIGNGKVEIIHNQLTFKWTPLEIHLKQKYFSLTVNAHDTQGQNSQQVFLFIITRKNEPPYFKFPVLDEYLMHANEALEVDLTVIDPDQDSLHFNMNIPTSEGNPKMSNGKFYWKLNQYQIDKLKKQFPLKVELEVSEVGTDDPITITKTFLIKRSIKNEPPRILNLQNEDVYEGLPFHRTIFIQDVNDDFSDLKFEIIGAPQGMTWKERNDAVELDWTPDYNIIGIELKPKKFDMLMVAEDPDGSIDQRAFTLTVHHRENTEITYQSYLDYRDEAIFLIDNLSEMHIDLERRETRVKNLKKGLSVMTMLFAGYTAAGNVFPDGTAAKQAVPYIGIMAAIAGGANAFGFNDLNKYGSLRSQIFLLQQKLIYVLAILREYNIDGPSSLNLENAEFRDQLSSYEQWMVQDKLNFKSYYNSYKGMNYIQKRTKKQVKRSARMGKAPEGLLFIDLTKI